MKGEVPGCEPGIFPLVRHRHDIAGQEVTPIAVAAVLAPRGRRRLQRIAVQPPADVEVVKLLVPKHAGKGLALDAAHVLVGDVLLQDGIKGVGLGDPLGEDFIEAQEGIRVLLAGA